jgi:superfamily I DNA/RNA helicase
MSWLIPRDELTAEQIRAVELSPSEHRVILGAPGSGKTQILLHRARFLSDEGAVQPGRFHVFVFTNVLKNYIRTALTDLDLPDNCVSTLDDWCAQIYKQEIRSSLPWDKASRCPDYGAVRKAVHKLVKDRRPFDFILVDEGQDLDADAFSLLKDLGPHVTVAMDHKQQIYDEGCGEAEIIRALGLRRSNLTLLDAFRCCPYIVRVASEFIEDVRDRAAFLNQSRTSQTEIQTPLLYEADGFEDERARLIEVLRERQIVDRTIGILFAQNRQVEGFAQGLREAGIPVETRKSGLDFANQVPKILTIHSAKGLTFDSVLMPRLVSASFSGRLDGFADRLLYVGVTRATKWLYLSTVIGKSVPALSRIRNLASLKPPVVTLGQRTADLTSKSKNIPQLVEDDPLDIL